MVRTCRLKSMDCARAALQASRPAGGEQQQQDGAAASDAAAAATPLQPRTSVKASSVLTTPASAPKVAASDALAAAIARGNSAMAPKVEPKGTALPPGDAVFDVDAVPEASVQQLRVRPCCTPRCQHTSAVLRARPDLRIRRGPAARHAAAPRLTPRRVRPWGSPRQVRHARAGARGLTAAARCCRR